MIFLDAPPRRVALAALAIAALAACGRKTEPPKTDQPANATAKAASGALSSSLSMANPSSSQQLVAGFYAIEDSAWRWTAKRFVAKLAAPANAGTGGATLRFKFALPEVALKEYEKLGISCSAGSVQIPVQYFDTAGQHEFKAAIPPTAFQGSAVDLTFTLDKSLPPSSTDKRELGVIALQLALEPS
jgi:hypothetical protein